MNRRTVPIVLIALLVLVAGCDNNDTSTSSQGSLLAPSADKTTATPLTTELLDSLDYEEFHGSLLPGFGGWLQAEMKTWPGGCVFSIMVPPNALPGNINERVEFSMRIPTYQSYMAHADDNLPLIIRLEPSNVNFLVPVTVMGTYMPWAPYQPGKEWDYGFIDPDYNIYGVPNYFWVKRWLRVTYQVPHFSDWASGPIPD